MQQGDDTSNTGVRQDARLTMAQEDTLYFIQPHVLDRVLTGKFVAKRKQHKGGLTDERRNMLSPLNITRRAIRYEPLVFSNRRQDIIDCANALNSLQTKLVLVSGPSGRGKTSFIRGVVELMGGGKEQLLWFDVSRHTDFDEVIRFLIDFMTYIFRNGEKAPEEQAQENPVVILESLLRQAQDFPILIVIDNMDYLVAPDQTIRSRELKEAFNFLLSFPNVKLILAGKVLPFADMNPASPAVYNVPLKALGLEESNALIQEVVKTPAMKAQDFTALAPYFLGEPYLLFVFAMLVDRHPDLGQWQQQLAQAPDAPETVLLQYLYEHLSPTEHRILAILALIRHGALPSGLQAIVQFCQPDLLHNFDFKQLDQSYIRLLLKKVYPPQMVLNKLRDRIEAPESVVENDAIEAYYQLSEVFQEFIIQALPEDAQSQYHDRLNEFYIAEKNKHILNRVYQARIRHLVAEAQFHVNRATKLRRHRHQQSPVPPVEEPSRLEAYRSGMAIPPAQIEPPSPAEAQPPAIAAEALPWPNLEDTGDNGQPPALHPAAQVEPSGGMAAGTFSPATAGSAQPVPVSIQLTPQVISQHPVQLSEEDLARIAELISEAEQRPRTTRFAMPERSAGQAGPAFADDNTPVSSDPSTSQPVPEDAALAEAPSPHYAPPPVPAEPSPPPPPAPALPLLAELDALDLAEGDPNEVGILERLKAALNLSQPDQVTLELHSLGQLRLATGKHESAHACLLKALELSKLHGLKLLEFRIRCDLGHLYVQQYQHNKALKHLRKAEHLFQTGATQSLGKSQLAEAYRDMMEILVYRNDLAGAAEIYQQCQALLPEDMALKGDLLFQLGMAFDEDGQAATAIGYYLQSYEASQQVGDEGACAATLYNLGNLYYEQGDLARARQTMEACLQYDQRVGTAKDQFRSLMFLSKIVEAGYQVDMALQLARQALQLAQQEADKTNLASAYMRLGHLAEISQVWTQAALFYDEAQKAGGDALTAESRLFIHKKLSSLRERLV